MSQQTPTQELIARDLHGNEWQFKHIFRGVSLFHFLVIVCSTSHRSAWDKSGYFCVFNFCYWKLKYIFDFNRTGQPRRHLLTTGWSTFVTSKRLVAGDSFVFLRYL